MATKVPVLALPSELRYDHTEHLAGGAQFCCFDTLKQLKSYWESARASKRYACVGTGYMCPARFLETHEWIFSPTKEALVAAVVRWEEFRIAPRWFDLMSDEPSIGRRLQHRRATRRDLHLARGTSSRLDEAAYVSNSQQGRGRGRQGFWRLVNLPCGLSHFDWFSEQARFLEDPELPKERVEVLLQQATFDDWSKHRQFHEVEMLDASGIDAEIAYWEQERAEGREGYED